MCRYTSDVNAAPDLQGPFSQYMLAFLSSGKKSEFIFEINTHKTTPNPIARYNILKNGWKKIKENDVRKYIKIMNKFKKF